MRMLLCVFGCVALLCSTGCRRAAPTHRLQPVKAAPHALCERAAAVDVLHHQVARPPKSPRVTILLSARP